MAEQSSSYIGKDGVGDPGSSMKGVTGREGTFQYAEAMASQVNDQKLGFDLPVDSEHKALRLKLFSVAQPHMRAFHLSWLAFFIAFTSTFAAPPLVPIIRDNLDMNKFQLANSAIASVSGAIFSRIIMGSVCDLVGPRFGHSFLMMLTAPAVFSMATVHTATGYLICRMCIGFSLATFVSTQFWMSSMFTPKIVGVANGASAGWGNLGGGATQLIMPVLFTIIKACNVPEFEAWRISFLIPGCAHIIIGFLCLQYGQDLPDGQYSQLRGKGKAAQDKGSLVLWYALTNYRTWILTITYGYCFGVELTVDNVITNYYYDRFHVDLNTAGAIGASFGLMNFFSRPLGGIISDYAALKFGMRGRIWHLWIIQSLGGVFCIALGKMNSLSSSVVMLLFFSFCCQAACGATFGVVPFISRRSLGVISGMVGAGGSAGSAITTAIFFGPKTTYATQDGIFYMGVMILSITSLIILIYFRQWGGMIFPASKKPTATEENYYSSEYTKTEKEQGLHGKALKFAENSKGERGPSKAAQASAAEKDAGEFGKNSVGEGSVNGVAKGVEMQYRI